MSWHGDVEATVSMAQAWLDNGFSEVILGLHGGEAEANATQLAEEVLPRLRELERTPAGTSAR